MRQYRFLEPAASIPGAQCRIDVILVSWSTFQLFAVYFLEERVK